MLPSFMWVFPRYPPLEPGRRGQAGTPVAFSFGAFVRDRGYSLAPKIPKKPKLIDDFRAFIMKGNVLDMAVGIIIGLAFSAVVTSMVSDVIMPPVGLALGGADFSETYVVLKEGADGNTTYPSLAAAKEAGAVTWRVGLFVNTLINFMIVGFVIFMIVRMAAKAQRKKEEAPKDPTDKDCPKCLMKIPIKATKCGHCTADLD